MDPISFREKEFLNQMDLISLREKEFKDLAGIGLAIQ